MASNLRYWIEKYLEYKDSALCLDIETMGLGKPITVVGTAPPKDGEPDYAALVRGRDLTPRNVESLFRDAKALITFNGVCFDERLIRKYYPGVLPKVVNVDTFLIASQLFGCRMSLHTLERMLDIPRGVDSASDVDRQKRRCTSVQLWRWHVAGDSRALPELIRHNRQDTVNLYPIIERLVQEVRYRAECGTLPDGRAQSRASGWKRGFGSWQAV